MFGSRVAGGPADTVRSQAKSFRFPSYATLYLADIGYVARDGESFDERLVYFRSSRAEFGWEPIRMHTAGQPLPPDVQSALVEVYPNPFTDRLQLRVGDGVPCAAVRVIDVLGRTVSEGEGCPSELTLGRRVPSGTYVVTLTLHDGRTGAKTVSVVVTKR